jgi:chemotaxis protein methyltransferase CheR
MNGIVTYGEFELFRDLIYEKAGIRLRESRKTLVGQRLQKRLAAYGLSCYSQYYKILTNAPDGRDEMQEFINALTTNETYFYRHPEQFIYLSDVIIPELLMRKPAGSKPGLRIWSAGCASGEEPYSIAIQIRESGIPPDSFSVEILGSDINQLMIQRTHAAVYNAYATGRMNPALRDRYFIKEPDTDAYHLSQGIRKMVRFYQGNLLDPFLHGTFDVIFCRNVLIYFDQKTRDRVLYNLHRCLKPGGFLITGYAESLMNGNHPFKYLKPTLYQRPERIEAGAPLLFNPHLVTQPA